MNKGSIVLGVAAAVIGSGLFWAAGSKGDSGIAGWETLNVGMEQAVGIAESGDAPAAGGSEGGHQTKGNKQHLEKDAGQAEAAGNVEDGEKVKEAAQAEEAEEAEQAEQAEQAVQTSADEKATAAAAGSEQKERAKHQRQKVKHQQGQKFKRQTLQESKRRQGIKLLRLRRRLSFPHQQLHRKVK